MFYLTIIATGFWVIYGGKKFDENSIINPNCTDVDDSVFNENDHISLELFTYVEIWR